MASHARQQYYADWETLKKEAREFAMTDELKQKLDSIEWWAEVNVIEDVKVNWVSLEVVDKSVDVLVPLVIDNLYTVDWDNALSAKQWKILYDYIQNLQSRGRYLSNWNTATWLPSTNPSESPYEYRSGDYFVVSVVAQEWGTNYRPDGSSYTIGVASTTVEAETVKVTDIYLYDWTNWLLLTNSTREIPIDDALSTTSTNPVENRVVTNAINTKQDKLIAWNNIQIAQDGKTISATDTTYSAWTNVNIDANNVISAVDTTYTAWANINIDANNVISATDTVYAEWTGIDITNNVISNEWVLTVNGSNWTVTVNDVKVGATAPANPTEGMVWYDTTNDILKMYDGTNWNLVDENDSAVWWNITGTLSNQTDLQNALDAKQNKFFTKSTTAPSNPSEWDLWYDDTNNVMKFYDGTEWKKIDTDTDINATWWNITGTLSNQTDLQTALDTDRLKSFYLPADVTTAESLATAQAAYEYMAVGVPVLRMGSMYDTSPWTLTFFPVKKVNQGESWTMIFLSTQLSKATSGGYTMVFQDRVEFTVTDWQVTSITKQFTNSSSALFRFLETNVAYSSTYTPSYSWSPTNKKYVDKWDTAVSATAPGTDLYEGKLWYNTTNDVLYSYDGSNWNATGKVYTAWTGIDITNDVISCTLNPVTVSQTAPSNPESWDLWFNTTKQTLNLYNWTSWVLVGPEIVPITKAAYDLLSSADKNDWRFYLITDNDWTIYVEWANVQNAPISAGTTAPSSPNEWDIWYDTTNDILKVYDGTDWNWVGQWSWDMLYSDFNFVTKTWSSVTLSLASAITPSSNFTVNVPSDLKDWQEYILRVDNWATAYTMTLGNNITNPYSVDLTLTANGIDQFVFLATNGWLELQPSILTQNAVNTKTFYISSESDLTTAQEIYDWYADWNLPILYWNNNNVVWKWTYTLEDWGSSSLTFTRYDVIDQSRSGVPTEVVDYYVIVSVSSWTVTWITRGAYNERVLTTNNSKTYTPTSDYNPATKKYVDDTKPTSWAWAPATTPSYIWQQYVDTTNDMLYVATGTSSSSDWTLVGANTWVEVQVISQSDYDALSEAEKNADVIYLITGWSGWLTVAWANITWKPDLIINPSGWTAWQLLAKTANGYEWTTVNSATWWNISGTLSDQADLQTALDDKQDELTAWTNITINNNTISADTQFVVVDTLPDVAQADANKIYVLSGANGLYEEYVVTWWTISNTYTFHWNWFEEGYDETSLTLASQTTLTVTSVTPNETVWSWNWGISFTDSGNNEYRYYDGTTFVGAKWWYYDDWDGGTITFLWEDSATLPAWTYSISWGSTDGSFDEITMVDWVPLHWIKIWTNKASWWMQLAPNSPLTPTYFWYWTQAQYEALSQYYTDVENDTVYFTIDS